MANHPDAGGVPHNGHGAAFQPDAAQLIGHAVARNLAQVLPQALAQVLSSVPVTTVTQPRWCAPCAVGRLQWEAAHGAELEASVAAAAKAAAEMEPGDPRAGRLDPVSFLPAHLRPSPDPARPNPQAIPDLRASVTTVQGTEFCAEHIPGAPGRGSRLLVASAGLSPAMLGQLARA